MRAYRGLARSRLVRFAVLGVALFAIAPTPSTSNRVALDGARLAAAAVREATRAGLAAPPATLVARITSRAAEDAILVREARRLGLDRGDAVIEARLVQKMMFLAEDLGGASRELEEDDLRTYFAGHAGDYVAPARIELWQIFATSAAELRAVRDQVIAFDRAHPSELPPLGRGGTLERRVSSTVADLERRWGAPFVAATAALPLGTWSEPIASRVGHHLVKVVARVASRPATFPEVRDRVALDALVKRRQLAVAAYVEAARARYDVHVDGVPLSRIVSSARTAVRTGPSVED